MRVIALLLAVMMMTGARAQVWASPDVTSVVDDAPDEGHALPVSVAVPLPERRELVCIEAPGSPARGRLHAVFVFRPPRLFASR